MFSLSKLRRPGRSLIKPVSDDGWYGDVVWYKLVCHLIVSLKRLGGYSGLTAKDLLLRNALSQGPPDFLR